jgi:IS5 family transposase
VLRDAKYDSVRDPAPATMYVPYAQTRLTNAVFELRTAAAPSTVMGPVRDTIRQIDPNLPVTDVSTQIENVEKRFAQEKLFAQVIDMLQQKGLLLRKGTIVDSTLIEAPSSTKNREKQRDSEAHQVKKGNAWHFGYKAHIGVDRKTGLVHHLEVTSANVHDVTVVSKLLTGEETEVYGDSGYLGAEKREDAITHNSQGTKIRYKTNRRPSQSKNRSTRSQSQIKRRELEKSSVRAKVEHVFESSKGYSDIAKPDTEVCENRRQN